MNPVGELYSLPSQTEEGAPIPAAPLSCAQSLLGAKQGEGCTAEVAEIKAAKWETGIDAVEHLNPRSSGKSATSRSARTGNHQCLASSLIAIVEFQ